MTKGNCYSLEQDNLKRFEKVIKKALYQTAPQEREDLEQELYIKLFEKMKNLNFREEAPSFWGLFEKN
ncbi:hypothetical protein [Schinkia azotoformans]|uniref:hypothetical protein n=1 Tax=Schinkia azotoformans TaxID=1454 RepID=UPI002DB9609D|nr:hypothetical protein [Schinkia azotoformans]MEC1716481.1 hypothetical protein [Schinkia azotoformans]MEC1739927.1 hypothetical protein [Schinkia azotoformans]MEC1746789.1 hypothetical protein [Schinkia azotoformans]MEC1758794.1 hypothetical protein [Schinkia azotoformans]MEC1767661.1 hypothetical protein [Schinkia azotoformans]